MDISGRITELRESKKLSKNQLAKKAGIAQSFISDIEAGKKSLTIEYLSRICLALNISLAEFFSTDQDLSTLPPDIWEYVSKKENHGLLKEIIAMKEKGYSNELIYEWLKSLDNTIESIKHLGVYWGKAAQVAEEIAKYSVSDKEKISKKLEEKLKDPGFDKSWKK